MIPEKIRALFDFVEYLNRNKSDYIEKYIPLCKELSTLDGRRVELKPSNNYNDKLLYDKIQNEIREKFEPIQTNVYVPTLNKLRELKIWSGEDTFVSIWNNNISEITEFNRNFSPEDISTVIYYKQMYINFRTETNTDFLCLSIVLNDIDEILKVLFDFFKDSNQNEFESFETKTIEVNNTEDAVKGLVDNKGKNVRFSIPTKSIGEQTHKQSTPLNINNEFILGNKIEIRDITDNLGQISIGNNSTTNTTGSDEITVKTFHWQKWGIIVGTIIGILAIAISIYLA